MRILRWTVCAFAVLLALTIGVYLGFVHPNDARVDVSSLRAAVQPPSAFKERAASLLIDKLPHALDVDAEAFEAAREGLMQALPEFAIASSRRFSSPYQVYAPIGSYPYRLDARDALFVPAGKTLRIEPGLAGELAVETAALAPAGGGALVVRHDGAPVARADLAKMLPPIDDRSAWARNVTRFWRIDRGDEVSRWSELAFTATLTPASVVEMSCEAAPPGCLVVDVRFLRASTRRPRNVVMVLVDTMRGDGPFGGNAPAMTALGSEATVFTRALAPGNMTSPSTNALLSCRKASDLGAVAFMYAVSDRYREDVYKRGLRSFAHAFREAGYETAMIGNVSVISEVYGVGIHHGFDRQVAIERDAYDTPDITLEAVDWLRRRADRPFLLYLHYNGPHAPYRAPLADLSATFPGLQRLRSYPDALRWLYQSEIRYTDRYLAHVLRTLKELGIDQDTTFILTADHGDQHTERRFTGNEVGPDFEGAYFDHGATLYNDEVRVPLLVRHAGQERGEVVNDVVSTLDVGPTLLDEAGLPVPAACAGRSLMPAARAADAPSRVIGTEGFQGRAIVFDGKYKYIRTYEPTDKRVYERGRWGGERRQFMAREQLFDLDSDPAEARDLSRRDTALLNRARALFTAHYRITEAHELAVEAGEDDRIEVTLPLGTSVSLDPEDGAQVTTQGEAVHVSGRGGARLIIRVKPLIGAAPVVRVNDIEVPVRMTSMGLPLATPLVELPLEEGGRFTLLDAAGGPSALLRRVVDDGQAGRRIVTGNARFERVLREWGYLNDR